MKYHGGDNFYFNSLMQKMLTLNILYILILVHLQNSAVT